MSQINRNTQSIFAYIPYVILRISGLQPENNRHPRKCRKIQKESFWHTCTQTEPIGRRHEAQVGRPRWQHETARMRLYSPKSCSRLGKGSDSKHRGPITVSGIVNIRQGFSVKVAVSRKCSTPFGPSRLAAKPLGANPLDHDLRY